MAKTKPDINSGLSWLKIILQLCKEYGVFNILKGLFILIMLSLTLRICYNPSFLFDKYTDYMTQRHTKELYKRTEYDQQVKSLLPVYLYKYHADRVWIIQYHNGIMDWQHGTMRFELCNDGVESIKNQYNDFNLTWINLPYYLKENEVFIGDVVKLDSIDSTLYTQLKKNDVQYLACTIIKDSSDYPIGILGVTWKNIPPNIDSLQNKIHNYLIDDRADIKTLIQSNYNKE